MTGISTITRTTQVVSISLPPRVFEIMEKLRENYQQSRSAFVASLIKRFTQEDRWNKIYKLGEKTKRRMNISTEEDIDRILHDQ